MATTQRVVCNVDRYKASIFEAGLDGILYGRQNPTRVSICPKLTELEQQPWVLVCCQGMRSMHNLPSQSLLPA